MKVGRMLLLANPPIKRRARKCHIRGDGYAGTPMLCGLRGPGLVHGGMLVATCKRCLRSAFLAGHLQDGLLPEVARHCLSRMRRMGVSTTRPQAAQDRKQVA